MVQDCGKYAQIEVPRPPEIETYNLDAMCGVDQDGQMTQNIGAKRRTRDWSNATFCLLEVVLMHMIILWCSFVSLLAGLMTYKQWAGELESVGFNGLWRSRKNALRTSNQS